jgi:type I restriction enzyme S subunit
MERLSKDEVLRIVRELHRHLDLIYGDRLKGVYLYGSYARGDARDESDIDVAVVLDGEVNRWDERERMGEVVSDICLKENCLILTMPVSESEFKEKPFDFHRNLAAEGIPV